MKHPENIKQIAALQPDYMGFIFYQKSSRYFNGTIPELNKNIKKTGVFVNETLAFVTKTIQKHKLQAVQLHGKESPEYCEALKPLGVEIIKVFSIKDTFNFKLLEPFETVCNYFLFDTKGKLPGGNGYTFNWDVLSQYPSSKPCLKKVRLPNTVMH